MKMAHIESEGLNMQESRTGENTLHNPGVIPCQCLSMWDKEKQFFRGKVP